MLEYAIQIEKGMSELPELELERKLLHQYENLQLEDRLDIDLTIDGPNLDSNSDLLIESDEMNYSQLRELQRRTSNKM